MSIDLNWETLTTGPDGEALALRIRDFIHTKFQAVPLPRFIKSVKVHDFEFGTIAPELELKDITDPLPEFYEENSDIEDDEEEEQAILEEQAQQQQHGPRSQLSAGERRRQREEASMPPRLSTHALRGQSGDFPSPFLGVSTPGILGGTSNLHYFQSHLGTGWSGTQTPLAAVAGAHMGNRLDTSAMLSPVGSPPPNGFSSPSHSRNPSQSSISVSDFNPALAQLREKSSVSTLAPTSAGASRPPTRDTHLAGSAIQEEDEEVLPEEEDDTNNNAPRFREPRPEDLQAVFRIRYAGDVRLRLTAEILLDYPMPSFVGIPVQLSVTGLTFDGVGVMAHIRKRVQFCFLSPEDAVTAVGADDAGPSEPGKRFGGLLQEIQVESEIGLRDGGKQSLKNVGKVERFVLEQVRRIFENEFVYPSFWTFLV